MNNLTELESNLRDWIDTNWPEKKPGYSHSLLKLDEEYQEFQNGPDDPVEEAAELADIIIAAMNFLIIQYGSLKPLEDKLTEVLARTDQAERDKARGIG